MESKDNVIDVGRIEDLFADYQQYVFQHGREDEKHRYFPLFVQFLEEETKVPAGYAFAIWELFKRM